MSIQDIGWRGAASLWLFLVAGSLWAACSADGLEGPAGPTGLPGPSGTVGPQGPSAPTPCPGATPGLGAVVQVAKPGVFMVGQSPEIIIRFTDRCGSALQPASLGTANLYLSGPREPLLNRTAAKLLNCVVDRAAPDRQHHFINLLAPRYNEPSQQNLSQDADGSLHYRLAAVSDEAPGTYTVGVWAKSQDEKDQIFSLLDLQIGTATPETWSSGPPESSTCLACHKGTDSGKVYMHHIEPGFSPLGNYAIDQLPLGTCGSCHNNDGYSANTILRKVHSVHRGHHMTAPGIAHSDYGLPADSTMLGFVNVEFPSMPDGEKDCAKCHADSRYLTAPSRLACGTCHDNVFFDTGVISPPISRGKPGGKNCTIDADCGVGQLTTCNVATGVCEVSTHPKETDDADCSVCHSADNNGIVPIATSHAILTRTAVRGLQVKNLALSGGSGPGGAVLIGDSVTFTFQLTDRAGTLISDLKTNKSLSTSLIIGGPSEDRQRVNPTTSVAGAALGFDGSSYSYTLPIPFPAQAQLPYNSVGLSPRPNPAGTYSAWLYVSESLSVNGQSVRDAGSALIDFRVGSAGPVQPRKVVLREACSSCHVTLQLHGGSRRDAEGCSLCHAAGAVDRTVGAIGAACTMTSQCGGATAGYEACQDTDANGSLDHCVLTADPTPQQSIRLSVLVHDIHYARKRAGYAERNNLIAPGGLTVIGFNNGASDFSEVLLPQDVRNCSKCHADTLAACSTSQPCAIGQQCVSSVCRNSAYTEPTSEVCLSCHDESAAFGHAALNTWKDSSGNLVETCSVCHGPDAEFAVKKVHNITNPYVPPYTRE